MFSKKKQAQRFEVWWVLTLSPNVKSDRGAQNLGAQNLRFDRGGHKLDFGGAQDLIGGGTKIGAQALFGGY